MLGGDYGLAAANFRSTGKFTFGETTDATLPSPNSGVPAHRRSAATCEPPCRFAKVQARPGQWGARRPRASSCNDEESFVGLTPAIRELIWPR